MDSGRLEAAPSGAAHLDTVRALHQTVVSLRTALEFSKNELKQLKEKYERHSNCLEYTDVIEKLTLENHILRRRIIDSGPEDNQYRAIAPDLKLEVTYSPHSQHFGDLTSSEVVIATATVKSTIDDIDIPQESDENSNYSAEKLEETPEITFQSEQTSHEASPRAVTPQESTPGEPTPQETTPRESAPRVSTPDSNTDPDQLTLSLISQPKPEQNQPSFKTKLELLSKFDVRIKVRTLKEGTVVSSTTSDSESTEGKKEFEESESKIYTEKDSTSKTVNIKSYSTENIRMAVPNEVDTKTKTDKFDVQVRITSEENLIVNENVERSRKKDTLNLDVDDLSLRSLSEGDNSVFSETAMTPVDPHKDDKQEDNASGNESEVDDIELIFTTDESRDMSNLQEDLVSIRETDNWAPQSSTHSTPVLIKFHTLDPDFQPGDKDQNNTQTDITKIKRVSLPNDKEIRHVAFNGKGNLEPPGRGILKSGVKSENMLYKRSPNASTKRIDSIDSLTCEYNRGLSLDNTKSSSFELGSSMDILHRDESVDSFHRNVYLGHRFSVFAERDISKCGTSEDDLAANLNVRRNTCPNPFQYRPSQYRVSRPPGPFKAGRVRPVLRDYSGPKRESGAQTDLCALPNRWSSDGYLAHKVAVPSSRGAPTVPSRVCGARRLTAPRAQPPTDETRRVLLSDIGFTSMVPELSRSADPVWALAKRLPTDDSITTSTSKFLSRGSSYRSPCLSIDRSSDWTPQHLYMPNREYHRAWRSSLPDVRRDDTEELLQEAEIFIRRSIDNLQSPPVELEKSGCMSGQPYIPASHKQLRLGHTVKVITPHGRIAVGRVRYVGLAGGSSTTSNIVVGAEFLHSQHPGLARNDGLYHTRRYFLTPPLYTALFVPFSKVVMAWTN